MDRLGDLVGFALYLRDLDRKSDEQRGVCEPFRLATATPETLRALAGLYWDRQHGED